MRRIFKNISSWFIDPITQRKLARFKSIKRGYYSFIIMAVMVILSIFCEVFVSNKALLVKYDGKIYFPTYAAVNSGETFGLDYKYEVNYRKLKEKLAQEDNGNYVIMPFVPYSPYESMERSDSFPPHAPSIQYQNYLGTDKVGRDVLARVVYGFRIAIWFSLVLMVLTYVIGIAVGCMMGYFGGAFDIAMQRVVEIWANIPFLYVIMIVASIIIPNFWMLLGIMVFFGWHGMTFYMRSATYKEKSREYVLAARSIGMHPVRIIFRHILPNSISLIVTFIPFSVASGISSLTALDYLGFGLPAPTPSWGELLDQGMNNMEAYWITGSVVTMLVLILTMVTFVGEAVREAFDPKKFTYYE